jgi:hypothetical protein
MLRAGSLAVDLALDFTITVEQSVALFQGAKMRKTAGRGPKHQNGSATVLDGETIALAPIRLVGNPKKELRVFLTCNISHEAEKSGSPPTKSR